MQLIHLLVNMSGEMDFLSYEGDQHLEVWLDSKWVE